MERERVVFDTNVLISGLLSATSAPARALERAVSHGQLVTSRDTLRELMTTLLSSKFDRYVSLERRTELLTRLAPLLDIVEIVQPIRASRDQKDDQFLEAAVSGQAAVIVTGDRDLLELHPFRSIAIVTPAMFMARRR
jgi:putative PIN family toxin of toxin-antitoxin system